MDMDQCHPVPAAAARTPVTSATAATAETGPGAAVPGVRRYHFMADTVLRSRSIKASLF